MPEQGKNETELLRKLAHRYANEVSKEANLEDMVRWIIEDQGYEPSLAEFAKILRDKLRKALQDEKTDDNVREWRVAKKGKGQKHLWSPRELATYATIQAHHYDQETRIIGDARAMLRDFSADQALRKRGQPEFQLRFDWDWLPEDDKEADVA